MAAVTALCLEKNILVLWWGRSEGMNLQLRSYPSPQLLAARRAAVGGDEAIARSCPSFAGASICFSLSVNRKVYRGFNLPDAWVFAGSLRVPGVLCAGGSSWPAGFCRRRSGLGEGNRSPAWSSGGGLDTYYLPALCQLGPSSNCKIKCAYLCNYIAF